MWKNSEYKQIKYDFPPSYYAFRVDIRYNQQAWKCFSFVVIYDINIVRGLKGLNWKLSR